MQAEIAGRVWRLRCEAGIWEMWVFATTNFFVDFGESLNLSVAQLPIYTMRLTLPHNCMMKGKTNGVAFIIVIFK